MGLGEFPTQNIGINTLMGKQFLLVFFIYLVKEP